MTKRQHFRASLPALVAGGAALVLDQFSKAAVLRELGPGGDHGPITVIPNVLWIVFGTNTGSAFGLFQGSSQLLKIVAILAVAVLTLYYLRAAKDDPVVSVALGLQVGGALGNIIDRFRLGYVVDWIHVPRWPTFNFADSAITVGVALLMYALIFREPRRLAAQEREQAAGEPRQVISASEDG